MRDFQKGKCSNWWRKRPTWSVSGTSGPLWGRREGCRRINPGTVYNLRFPSQPAHPLLPLQAPFSVGFQHLQQVPLACLIPRLPTSKKEQPQVSLALSIQAAGPAGQPCTDNLINGAIYLFVSLFVQLTDIYIYIKYLLLILGNNDPSLHNKQARDLK